MVLFAGIYQRRPISHFSIQQICGNITYQLLYSNLRCLTHWFSTESARSDFTGENAYDILGVSETCSFDEIKASFRKLAKETHPDLAQSSSNSAASQRFVQILAAYEILSDSEKRTHYDSFLLTHRSLIQNHSRQRTTLSVYKSHLTTFKQMEVVEWLKCYRAAINDILSENKVVVGTGYFDVLERDFYSAIHVAFYGPPIESMEFLPNRFEAEERSIYETPEVLHLVSGRDLFGMVCLADKVPELSTSTSSKLTSSNTECLDISQHIKNESRRMNLDTEENLGISEVSEGDMAHDVSDAYRDLELHVSGRVIAVATRIPPKISCQRIKHEDEQDHIHVFLNSHDDSMHCRDDHSKYHGGASGPRIPLGTIIGLGTSPDEGSCFVYSNSGSKTHVIMKHRTLMVKHLHWYSLGDEVSVCECRCSRACLPPSKFWLFEPRCAMHDIGGWYVETFCRDKKGRTVPSQRYWDGIDTSEQFDRKLHPAMYLLALAYRTLDIEDAKRRKQMFRDVIKGKLFGILSLSKKFI